MGYTVHRIAKSRTQLSDFTFTFMNYQRLARWHSGKESACQEMQETWIRSPGEKDPLEEEMATHSSILAHRAPGPGQAVAGLVLAVFGGRAGVSRLE